MPYIKQEDRRVLDELVKIMTRCGLQPDGKLNYVLFKFCKDTIDPSYNNYKNFLGELTECVEEIRRRLLGPYEDEKIKQNGDVK